MKDNIHFINDRINETLRKSVATYTLNKVSLMLYVNVYNNLISELDHKIYSIIRRYERYIS